MRMIKLVIVLFFSVMIGGCVNQRPEKDNGLENGNEIVDDTDDPTNGDDNGDPTNGDDNGDPTNGDDNDDPTNGDDNDDPNNGDTPDESFVLMIQEAVNSIEFDELQTVEGNFTVPLEHGNVVISWSSSDEDYLVEESGFVRLKTRPYPYEDAVTIVLTAYFSVGEEFQSVEYSFEIEPYVMEGRIALFYEGEGEYPIFGVIYAVHSSGYYIYDGENTAVVYDYNVDYQHGDLVMLEGYFYGENNVNSLLNPAYTFEASSSKVIREGVEVNVTILEVDFEDFLAIDFFDPYKQGRMYEITGRLDTFSASYSFINDLHSFDRVRFFGGTEPSDMATLLDLHGEYVTIPVIAHRYNEAYGVYVSYDSNVKQLEIHEKPIFTRVDDYLHQLLIGDREIFIEGIVVGGFDLVYYIFDGERVLSVHRSYYFTTDIEIGDYVRFKGDSGPYFYASVLYYYDYEIIRNDEDFTISSESITIEELYETIDIENPFAFTNSYIVQGTLIDSGVYGKYYLQSLDSDAYVVLDSYAMGTSAFNILTLFLNEDIEVELLLKTYTWTHVGEVGEEFKMVFMGDEEKIRVLPLSDEAILLADLNELQLTPKTVYKMNVHLPEQGLRGTVYSNWQSSHPELIDHDGTFVALPEEDTWITFTMTATYQTATQVFEYSVLAKAAPDTVKAALDLDIEEDIVIAGIVISHGWYEYGLFVQDEEGYGIFIVVTPEDYDRIHDGQKIIVHGTRWLNTEYSNLEPQLIDITIIDVLEGDYQDQIIIIDDQSLNDILLNDNFYARRFRVYDVMIDYHTEKLVRMVQSEGHLDPVYQLYFMTNNLADFDYPVGTDFSWIEFTVSRYYHGYGLFVSDVEYEKE